jgi:hypothetical protein
MGPPGQRERVRQRDLQQNGHFQEIFALFRAEQRARSRSGTIAS